MDPDRDGCGLLWCSPVVPNTGNHATTVAALAAERLHAWGFEPQISISLITERSLTCVITLSFDRNVPGEDHRALACYQELTAELLARGYPPYRLNVRSMGAVENCPVYAQILGDIKAVLDPNGVLAPGRYEAARSSSASESRVAVAR
jgi:4-cresol dehydrogenase (hydroxylating)